MTNQETNPARNRDLYYDKLGRHIQKFIVDKWDSQKRATKFLDMSESRLSKLISGERPANRQIITKLTKNGFDIEYFQLWEHLENICPEHLSKKEIIDLYSAQQFLILQQQKTISWMTTRLQQLTKDRF